MNWPCVSREPSFYDLHFDESIRYCVHVFKVKTRRLPE